MLNMLGSGDVDYLDPNVAYYSVGYLGLRPWSRQLFGYPQRRARPPPRRCNPVEPFGGITDDNDLITGYANVCAAFAKVAPTVPAIEASIDDHQILDVKATGDKTIGYTLTHPASYFQDILTMPACSPAPTEYLDALPGPKLADNLKTLLSDGPHHVADHSATKPIDDKRNPAWKASADPLHKAYVDEIKVDETVSQESTQQQLQTNTPAADMEWDNIVAPWPRPGSCRPRRAWQGPRSRSSPATSRLPPTRSSPPSSRS